MAGSQGPQDQGTGGPRPGWSKLKRKAWVPRSANSARTVEAEKRLETILELKLTGANNAAIARTLGMSREGVRLALVRAMDRLRSDNNAGADRLRALELARIDKALFAMRESLKNGHLGAVQRLERLIDLKSRLLGLFPRPEDAPPPDPREFAAKVAAFMADTEEL